MGSSNIPLKEQAHFSLLKKFLSYLLYALLPIVVLIHLYSKPFSFSPIDQFSSTTNNFISAPASSSQEVLTKTSVLEKTSSCDYSKGEWVPSKSGPLYNGTTCDTIKPGQNCMSFGRPDTDYLHWRWHPEQCKLPSFEPETFLKLLENKHVAFVGDSLARNQLESLLCMTAVAEKPNLFYTEDENKFRKWHFPSHNINVSIYWSPFLVKGIEKTVEKNFNAVYLDRVDERWARDLDGVDVLVLSLGHWYLHPAVYYSGGSVVGCHYYENCTETGFYDVFGKALNATFDWIIRRKGQNGNISNVSVFLTTFSPAHFEGEWDKLGACPKTKPYREGEKVLEGVEAEMRSIGVEEVGEAKLRILKEFGNVDNNKVRFEVLDITRLALLRADGHPGPYMNPFPFVNGVAERVQNDCVHWCLPGPIDTWNEILLDVIKRWGR